VARGGVTGTAGDGVHHEQPVDKEAESDLTASSMCLWNRAAPGDMDCLFGERTAYSI